MFAQVLIADADAVVSMWHDVTLTDAPARTVHHGHGPPWPTQPGGGAGQVRAVAGGSPAAGSALREGSGVRAARSDGAQGWGGRSAGVVGGSGLLSGSAE